MLLKVLGLTLLLLPFLGITIFMIKEGGIETALITWGITITVVGLIGSGIYLLNQ